VVLGNRSFRKNFSCIGLPADITNPLLIDHTNTVSITAQLPIAEVGLSFLPLLGMTAPTTVETLLGYLPLAIRTEDERQSFIAARALHLFLLEIEILDKALNIPFVSSKFVEEPLRPLIRKKPVQVVTLPGVESVKV
jgi:hypothetical protein